MTHFLSIVGSRPQYVKLAALSSAAADLGIPHEFLDTGQHYDKAMAETYSQKLSLPAATANLGAGGLPTPLMLAKMFEGLYDYFQNVDMPAGVLVYGDTNSTLAGAVVAADLGIPVFHIEAGLRSGDSGMREERNRRMVDSIASLNLAPTPQALNNLRGQNFSRNTWVGDVMYDMAMRVGPPKAHETEMGSKILLTVHRESNTSDVRLMEILEFVDNIAFGSEVIWPVHPRIKFSQEVLLFLETLPTKVRLTTPLDYFEMQSAIRRASFVVTDSGGLQKEAAFAGKRAYIPRLVSEWSELVELGSSITESPLKNIDYSYLSEKLREPFSADLSDIFGDGKASENCWREIMSYSQDQAGG